MNNAVLLLASTLGWVGAVGTVIAYALVSRRRLDASSATFQAVNAVGAALLGLSAMVHANWSSAASNGIWMLIAMQALLALARTRRPVATVTPLHPDPTPAAAEQRAA